MPVAKPDNLANNQTYLVFYRNDHKSPELFVSDVGPQVQGITPQPYRPDYVDLYSASLSTSSPIQVPNWQKSLVLVYFAILLLFVTIAARR
jgi:hypothetical protein